NNNNNNNNNNNSNDDNKDEKQVELIISTIFGKKDKSDEENDTDDVFQMQTSGSDVDVASIEAKTVEEVSPLSNPRSIPKFDNTNKLAFVYLIHSQDTDTIGRPLASVCIFKKIKINKKNFISCTTRGYINYTNI
ncbi:hypothetical protein RFI_16921, partial [Reticulomyxa filosa]